MATKSQDAANEAIQLGRAHAKKRRRPLAKRPPTKPHNLGDRAGRGALVRYETSSGRSSRKSTRKSRHRQRPASPLEHRKTLKETAPETKAERAKTRKVKVRGKTRADATQRRPEGTSRRS